MTSAKRQAALKARRQAAGLKLVSVWVPVDAEQEIRKLAAWRRSGKWTIEQQPKQA